MCAALQIVSRICAASISRRMPSLLLSLNEAVAAFRCYPPPHPSPQTRRGFPALWGCPAASPLVSLCVDLIGVVISAGAGGALCILPAALTLGVQDWGGGGVPIQPAGAPGCPHGAAEAGEGIRAEQPPLLPPIALQ